MADKSYTFIRLNCAVREYQTYLGAKYGHRARSFWTSDIRVLSQRIPPSATVYTDAISKKGLEFFWKYSDDSSIINFEAMQSTEMVKPGSYVFIQKEYLKWLTVNAGMWLSEGTVYRSPPFVTQQPAEWDRVYQSHNATLFQVK